MQAKKITLAIAIGLIGIVGNVNAEELIPKNGRSCPNGYTSAGGNYCRKIEPITNADLGHVGTFPKRDKGDRCPSGYFTNVEGTECGTQYNPAPKVRMKSKGACKEGETEEWGLYCTSNLQVLTPGKIENASNRDVDNVYMASARTNAQRKWATQGNGLPEGYKVVGGASKSSGSSNNNSASSATAGNAADNTAGQIGEAVGQELKNQAVKGLMKGLFN